MTSGAEKLAQREWALRELHVELASCRACAAGGFPVVGVPMRSGDERILQRSGRLMLVGQAPGRTEASSGRPFSGPAGRRLFGWFQSVGIPEETFRELAYFAAMTRCFPGAAPNGHGDRRPSRAELALCRGYLDRALAIVQPTVVLLVGGMAIEALLGKMSLDRAVGIIHKRDGVRYLPLPHPSGASTWMNDAEHQRLLRQALDALAIIWHTEICPVGSQKLHGRVIAGAAD